MTAQSYFRMFVTAKVHPAASVIMRVCLLNNSPIISQIVRHSEGALSSFSRSAYEPGKRVSYSECVYRSVSQSVCAPWIVSQPMCQLIFQLMLCQPVSQLKFQLMKCQLMKCQLMKYQLMKCQLMNYQLIKCQLMKRQLISQLMKCQLIFQVLKRELMFQVMSVRSWVSGHEFKLMYFSRRLPERIQFCICLPERMETCNATIILI